MNVDISGFDLLYLTLSVLGYAIGATIWTCLAAPRREQEISGVGHGMLEGFDATVPNPAPDLPRR